MRLGAALIGNLEEVLAAEKAEAERAITSGTRGAADKLKARLRAIVVQVFSSQRLANTWRGVSFPGRGQTSLGPTELVFSKAPHIMEAFSASTTIRSKTGFWLAIPSPDAPKIHNGRRVTPSNFPEARFGDLRFVYRRGKSSLLVVDGVRRSAKSGRVGRQIKGGGMTADGGYRKGYASVVMFFLVPFVRLKQAIDLDREYEQALTDMVGMIIAAWTTGDT